MTLKIAQLKQYCVDRHYLADGLTTKAQFFAIITLYELNLGGIQDATLLAFTSKLHDENAAQHTAHCTALNVDAKDLPKLKAARVAYLAFEMARMRGHVHPTHVTPILYLAAAPEEQPAVAEIGEDRFRTRRTTERTASNGVEDQRFSNAALLGTLHLTDAARPKSPNFEIADIEAARIDVLGRRTLSDTYATGTDATRINADCIEAQDAKSKSSKTANIEADAIDTSRINTHKYEAANAQSQAARVETTQSKAQKNETNNLETACIGGERIDAERIERALVQNANAEAAEIVAEGLTAGHTNRVRMTMNPESDRVIMGHEQEEHLVTEIEQMNSQATDLAAQDRTDGMTTKATPAKITTAKVNSRSNNHCQPASASGHAQVGNEAAGEDLLQASIVDPTNKVDGADNFLAWYEDAIAAQMAYKIRLDNMKQVVQLEIVKRQQDLIASEAETQRKAAAEALKTISIKDGLRAALDVIRAVKADNDSQKVFVEAALEAFDGIKHKLASIEGVLDRALETLDE